MKRTAALVLTLAFLLAVPTPPAGAVGTGAFVPHPTSPSFGAGDSRGMALGDLDSDGDLDAVVANAGGQAETVWLNDGAGAFMAHPTTPAFGASNSIDVALGDLDSDGDLDAVVANSGSEAETVWLNGGTGVFTAQPSVPSFGAGSSSTVALGDLDADGDLDAVVANFNGEAETVWLNGGTGVFTAQPSVPSFGAGSSSTDVALGDLDADGDLDAVVANFNGEAETVWLNGGAGVFTAQPSVPSFGAGSGSTHVALGDLDGDGDLDAVVANFSGGEAETVWLNGGAGAFTAHPSTPSFGAFGESWDVALGDLDGDGDLDAVVANDSNQAETVWVNGGTGVFTAHPTAPAFGAGFSQDVALGDLDGDSDLDAIVANAGQAETVWVNVTAASLSIDDVTLPEGDAGTTSFAFTITRSGNTSIASSVTWSTADGSAVAPGDYTAVGPTIVNFAPGETTKTVSVTVNGDTTVEANDGFTVNLANPVNAVIGDGTGVGRITNDDAAAFSVDDVTVSEGDAGTTLATFTVSRAGDTGDAATVQWRTLDAHAVANGDYLAVPLTTVSFGPGETTKQVSVTVNGDTTFEPTEEFYVRLSNPTGLHTLADATGLGTITNDDGALSIGDATVAEGNAGTSLATFTVTRAGDASDAASVQWFTLPGTATAGDDFVAVVPNTLAFAAGETSKPVSVTINGDTVVEANETFVVRLGSPVNASVADGSGLGRITNDDHAGFSVNDATVTEGNAGTTTATFTVTRSGAAGGTATVQWSTADGTATAASGDYVAVPATTVTFGPGETSKPVTVTVNGDTVKEANETFQVRLTSPTGASLADGSGLGRITNDD